jgi:hypothetical protein
MIHVKNKNTVGIFFVEATTITHLTLARKQSGFVKAIGQKA